MTEHEGQITKRIVGMKVLSSPDHPNVGVVPLVPFPATKAEQTRAEKEASKAALLLRRPSPGQLALLRHLAESSPGGSYVVTSAKWIDTILKATKGLREADMAHLHGLDWAERTISPKKLRNELLQMLKLKPPSPR